MTSGRPRGRSTRLVLAVCLLLAALASDAEAAGFSLRFFGNAEDGVDRVKIRIDDPGNANPGPPADIGATDFTLEFWMKASVRENTAPALECGGNVNWLLGNIVIDRNRFNQDRKFGVSIAGGRVVFGVSGDGSGDRTICGFSDVLDEHWHHVAVERRRADGWMWLYVDGTLEAEADGPDGDISYPDDGVPADACGAPCVESDPFLVLGAAKHGAAGQFRSYSGWLDEIRLSRTLRYTSQFTRPTAPFVPDADTAALYHLDEGIGDVITDSSQAPGGPSHGARDFGGAPAGPAWSTDTPPLDHPAVALLAIATSLAKPVAIAHAGDGSGRLFIVLQEGRIVIHDGQGVLPEPFLDVRALVSCCGEQGLLGLAFHPGYAGNGYFFVNYTDLTGATVIARYSVSASNPDSADPNSAVILLTIPQPFSNHNGGQLKFGPDGYLYIGMGDGGSGGDPQNNAQNLGTLLGKMLRIDVDGVPRYAVPPDNPFVTTPGARPEIWALGLRNPWRFTFDRATGDLFIGDVGQDRWEEISFQLAASQGGENFGWRLMEGTHCFNPERAVTPARLPCPSSSTVTRSAAPSRAATATGAGRSRSLHGTYLYADFCSGRLWGASQDGGGQWSTAELLDTALNISTFGEDEAGEIYLAHRPDDATGAVYRITHPSPHAVPTVTGLTPATVIAGGPSFTLRVGGAGFASSSVVRWNGQDRPTTFVSDAQLSAEIPGTDIAAAGRAALTVFTPEPGGGLSGSVPLDVNTTLFLDVPSSFWASGFIEALARAGITAGCGSGRFCPDETVTRAQMAIFLGRGMAGSATTPPPATGTVFIDVPTDAFAAAWIEQLARMGITAGCGGGAYCPDRAITREEMAVLLLRAQHGAAYQPPPASGSVFSDVSASAPFAAWIERLAAEGITAGCGGGLYCPASAVTRAQMAVFLVRTFSL